MLDKTKLNYVPNTLLYCKPTQEYRDMVEYVVNHLNREIKEGSPCSPSWRVRYPDLEGRLKSEVHSLVLYICQVLSVSYPTYAFKVEHEYICGISFSVTLQNKLKKI